ncbi:ADAM 17 Protease [Daphnia magna]|uniref:ADAM 17 Protease n=1 Tax=Daphnia magna TaxID=35525 RepID=A0A162R8V1_9CRUS|nr:ADAM 17 Protease [Daphnia magna]
MELQFKLKIFLTIWIQTANAFSSVPSLKHYDTLHSSQLGHSVVKRGIKESSHPYNSIKELSFSALGKDFRLILHPSKGILHHNFQSYAVDGDGVEKPILGGETGFYQGRVFGETRSHVNAHIENGLLTASIVTKEDSFHVEPSWRHLPEPNQESMIVYRGSDVIFDNEPPKWNFWMSNSAEKNHSFARTCASVQEEGNATEEAVHASEQVMIMEAENNNGRNKRQAGVGPPDPYGFSAAKTRCPLLLVADYRFFREMGGGSTKTTINYLISLVDRVHALYAATIWRDGNENEIDSPVLSGLGFVIKKIVVHTEATRVRESELHYNMEKPTWDVRTLLEVFSREYSHKDYCLAHLFTDIKFEGGILGLAYVGSPRRNSVGGICTPEYFKSGYTLYLNSGLSSSRNHYGQRVVTREADLVTAHELGHNWGSEHDPDLPECSPPASQGGSYLMYTYSVSGYDVNNKKFSPCSLRSIRAVLLAKAGRCFTEPEESFCGNLRVEGKEECDAGLLGSEDNDSCCDKFCNLRRNQGAVCSDKNSPCCKNCMLMPAGQKCREAQRATCEQEAKCTGTSSECPASAPQPDGTECLEKGQCRNGTCLPFCETQNYQSCMCDTVADACKRCCRYHLNDTCFPFEPYDILPDGTPCVHGFCNSGICEKTVQDIVERFWDIVEELSINRVLSMLKDNLVGAVLIVSTLLWIPASCLISWVDRKRKRQLETEEAWLRSGELIHPSENGIRRIIHARLRPSQQQR